MLVAFETQRCLALSLSFTIRGEEAENIGEVGIVYPLEICEICYIAIEHGRF